MFTSETQIPVAVSHSAAVSDCNCYYYRCSPSRLKDLLLSHILVLCLTVGNYYYRCTPARLKDLLLSHILVLCLIMDNFTTSLSHLQKDLKVSAKKYVFSVSLLLHADCDDAWLSSTWIGFRMFQEWHTHYVSCQFKFIFWTASELFLFSYVFTAHRQTQY